jgi:phenylacetate-CoA ligase
MLDDRRLAAIRDRLAELLPRSPGLARQLGGVDPADLRTPQDFERLPLLRRSELAAMQAAKPPFGGLAAAPTGAFTRLFPSAFGFFAPEATGRDPWGAARAFASAGVRAGEIAINAFSYHLAGYGRIFESGALTLGCLVIPAGHDDVEALLAAANHFRPSVYCGPAGFLKTLMHAAHAAEADLSFVRTALVPSEPGLRGAFARSGVAVRQVYATPELGVVAYEADGPDGALPPGLLVNDSLLIEIVTPGTNKPVLDKETGELVITRLDTEFPLLRLATGHLSSWVAHMRIETPAPAEKMARG